MCFYLHGDECLDRASLDLNSRSGNFNNLSIEYFIFFRAAGYSEKLNLENDIATRVLDHAIADVLVNSDVNNKDDVSVLGVAGTFKLLLNSILTC